MNISKEEMAIAILSGLYGFAVMFVISILIIICMGWNITVTKKFDGDKIKDAPRTFKNIKRGFC